MDGFVLTPAERALFDALHRRHVPFLVIGIGAAVLEGAPLVTQDLDIWFARTDDERLAQAAADAGGFWISGFGLQPPAFGGDGLERLDVVLTAHGLESFDVEYARAATHVIDGITVRAISLSRVVASKEALNRPKDQAQLPALKAALAAARRRQPLS